MLLWKSTEVNQVKQLMHIAILYSMQLQVTLKACKIYACAKTFECMSGEHLPEAWQNLDVPTKWYFTNMLMAMLQSANGPA